MKLNEIEVKMRYRVKNIQTPTVFQVSSDLKGKINGLSVCIVLVGVLRAPKALYRNAI